MIGFFGRLVRLQNADLYWDGMIMSSVDVC